MRDKKATKLCVFVCVWSNERKQDRKTNGNNNAITNIFIIAFYNKHSIARARARVCHSCSPA